MKKILIGLSIVLTACSTDPAVHFEWDFTPNSAFNYSYEQTTDNVMTGINDSESSGLLTIEIEIQGTNDSSGVLLLRNGAVTSEGETQNFPEAPPIPMKSSGRFEEEGANALFSIFLALPKHNLKLGETDSIPFEIPFYAMNQSYTSFGMNRITFEEVTEFEGHQCAVLKSEIDYPDPKFPAQFAAILKNNGNGQATCYFDIERGIILKNTIQMEMFSQFDATSSLTQQTEVRLDYLD